MKKLCILSLVCLLLFTACTHGNYPPASSTSTSLSSPDSAPLKDVVMVCSGAINHPVVRLLRLGFFEKAYELQGYTPMASGLTEGSAAELYAEWARAIDANNARGVILWVADDTAIEFLSNQHANGVKIVIPYWDVSALNGPNNSGIASAPGTIDANPICDEGKRLSDAAEHIVNRLTQNGVTSGTIAFHGNSYYQPAFREYIEANSSFSVVDGFVSDGIDNTPTIRNMVENNDIVAVYNPLGSPDEWSAVLGQSPKGAKIVYIAGVASKDNVHALMDGEIDAIVSRPYYEAGYIGMEMLDRVLQGETFAEDAWQPALPSYIVTADGAGKNGPDFYLDQYARAEAMFGPS